MGDFSYINARVKVMKSHLLPPNRVLEFFASQDLEAFIQALSDTPYNMELQEALSRFRGARAAFPFAAPTVATLAFNAAIKAVTWWALPMSSR